MDNGRVRSIRRTDVGTRATHSENRLRLGFASSATSASTSPSSGVSSHARRMRSRSERYPDTMPSRRMDGLAWHKDGRNEPDLDNDRRGAFISGWRKGVESHNYGDDDAAIEKVCSLKKLAEELTWWNLGYRLGRVFRATSDDLVQRMFEWSEEQYREKKGKGSR